MKQIMTGVGYATTACAIIWAVFWAWSASVDHKAEFARTMCDEEHAKTEQGLTSDLDKQKAATIAAAYLVNRGVMAEKIVPKQFVVCTQVTAPSGDVVREPMMADRGMSCGEGWYEVTFFVTFDQAGKGTIGAPPTVSKTPAGAGYARY